jgi:hypothetical protein
MTSTGESKSSYHSYIESTKPKSFTTINISAKTFVDQVQDLTYDLNPEHQRDVVHNDAWQSEVVKYLMDGKPLGCPEFDTVLDQDGIPKYRSLDGKQRCSAIVRFMTNQYPFKSNIPGIKGKYFKEWPREWRVHLERSQFAICQSEDTFSDKEVSEFFMTKQNTKSTKTGEKLNSINSSRIKLCRGIASRVPFQKTERHADLEMTCRMIYTIININSGKKIDPKPAVLINYMSYDDSHDEVNFKNYETIINKTICLNNSVSYESQHTKTSILPLLALVVTYKDNFGSVASFVKEKLDNNKFYENVNGEHDATTNRVKMLISEYNNWNTHGNIRIHNNICR